MSKKHFIALADTIRCNNDRRTAAGLPPMFDTAALEVLADFCAGWNSNFNQNRWLDYIAGRCGPNGGSTKPKTLRPNDIMQDGDEYWENGKWNPCVAEDFDEPVINGGYEKVRRP